MNKRLEQLAILLAVACVFAPQGMPVRAISAAVAAFLLWRAVRLWRGQS